MLLPRLASWRDELPARIALVLSAIAPPAYFWFEYHVIWRGAEESKRPPLDEYKLGQEMSRNLWLSFVAVLLALYFHNG